MFRLTQNVNIRFTGTANMAQVNSELAKMEAKFAALQESMATAVKGKNGIADAGILNAQNATLKASRIQFLENIAVQGQYNVSSVKLITTSQAFTDSMLKENVGVKQLWTNRKILNNVYKEQMALQDAMMMQYTKGLTGAVSADLISPRNATTSLSGLSKVRSELGFYNTLMGQVSASTVNWGKNTQWAGRQLMAGLSMPIAIVLGGLGALAFQMDKQLMDITKVYGNVTDTVHLTNEQIRKDATETASAMAETYGVSSKQTLEVMGQLAAIGMTGKELRLGTEAVTKAQILGNLNVDDAVRTSITLQSAFGMTAKETADAFAYMNAMENATSLTMEDFTVSIPKVAGIMKLMNVDLKDTGVLMAAVKAGGIGVLEGANALKSAAFRVVAPTKGATTLFQQLTGTNYKEFETQYLNAKTGVLDFMGLLKGLGNKMEGLDTISKMNLVKQLFGVFQGSKNAALMMSLVDKNNDMVQRAMAVAASGQKGWDQSVLQEMVAYNESISTQLKKTFHTISTDAAIVGQQVLKMVLPILKWVAGLVTGFKDMSESSKKMTIITLGIVGLIGPIIMAVGLLGNLIGNVGKFTSAIGGLLAPFKAVSIEQQASKIAAQAAGTAILEEADAAKVLVFQLRELATAMGGVAAKEATMVAASAAMIKAEQMNRGTLMTRLTPGATWTDKNGVVMTGTGANYAKTKGVDGSERYVGYGSKTASAAQTAAHLERSGQVTAANAAVLASQTKMAAVESEKVAAASAKASAHWRGIAGGVGGLALGAGFLTSMITPSGSVASNVGNILVMLGMIGPLVMMMGPQMAAAGTAMAAWATKSAIIGPLIRGVAGTVKGIAPAFLNVLGVIAPFAGIIAGIGLAAAAAYLYINHAQDETRKQQMALNDSTKAWGQALGFSYAEGQVALDETGKKIETVDGAVQKFTDHNKEAAKAFSEMLPAGNRPGAVNSKGLPNSPVAINDAAINSAANAAYASAEKKRVEDGLRISFNESIKAALHGAGQQEALMAGKATMKMLGFGAESEELFIKAHGKFDFTDMTAVGIKSIQSSMDIIAMAGKNQMDQSWAESVGRFLSFSTRSINTKAATAIEGIGTEWLTIIGNTATNNKSEVWKQMEDSTSSALTELYKKATVTSGAKLKAAGINNVQDYLKAMQEGMAGPAGQAGAANVMTPLGITDPKDVETAIRHLDAVKAEIQSVGKAFKVPQDQLDKFTSIRQIAPWVPGLTVAAQQLTSTGDALKEYNDHVNANAIAGSKMTVVEQKQAIAAGKTAESSYQMTKQQELQYLNNLRLNQGLEATGEISDGLTGKVTKVAGALDYMGNNANQATTYLRYMGEAMDATAMIQVRKSSMTDMVSFVATHAREIQDKADQSATDILKAHNQAIQDGLTASGVAMNRSFDARDKALSKSQDGISARLKTTQEAQVKTVTTAYDKRIAAIDAAIKAEKDAEKIRQDIFAAEKTRIQQMAAMFSKNIDFNAALATGNLDSAAKISNDMRATASTNNLIDAGSQSQTTSDMTMKKLDDNKTTLEATKKKKLDDIKTIQDAETKALDKKVRREKEALDLEKQHYNDGLEARKKSATASAAFYEKKQQEEQASNKKAIDAEVAALMTSIPTTMAGINELKNKVEAVYAKHGQKMVENSSTWSNAINNALVLAVQKATGSMVSDVSWKSLGAAAAKEMTAGAFDLTPTQFMKWVSTGVMPAQQERPDEIAAREAAAAKRATGRSGLSGANQKLQNAAYHTGGIVGELGSERTGFSGPISNMEQTILARHGEGILSNKAMGMLGKRAFHALNGGQHLASGGLVSSLGGGMFGNVMAALTRRSIGRAIQTLGDKKRSQEAQANVGADSLIGGGTSLFSGGVSAVWQELAAWIHSNMPGAQITSGYRPGAISSSGNVSMHARGLAVDIAPPSMARFNQIKAAFGSNIAELIYTPAGDKMIKNGKEVPTSFWGGTVLADHYNHIHWGMNKGRAGFAGGGAIPGNHDRDDVPLWGTPGEVMVPKGIVGRFGGPNSLMNMLGFTGTGGKMMPSLKTGGFTMSDGMANLHKNETVLTEPLSKKLREGINNMDKSQHTVYDVSMDFTGAHFTNDMDMKKFQKSVEDAMHAVDKRTGSGAANRNVSVH